MRSQSSREESNSYRLRNLSAVGMMLGIGCFILGCTQPIASNRAGNQLRKSSQLEIPSTSKNLVKTRSIKPDIETRVTTEDASGKPVNVDSKSAQSESNSPQADSLIKATVVTQQQLEEDPSTEPLSGPVVEGKLSESSDTDPIPVATDDADQVGVSELESTGASESLTWQMHVQRAIKSLESEMPTGDDEGSMPPVELMRREILLNTLRVTSGEEFFSDNKFQFLHGHEAEFWRHQLLGLQLGTQREQIAVSSKRAEQMLPEFHLATRALANQSSLKLDHVAFCTSVYGYADVEPIYPCRFQADQEVLLYVELENFVSDSVVDGDPSGPQGIENQELVYETEIHGSYEIVDFERQVITEHTLPQDKQRCRNPRRDYYIAYRIFIPLEITAGQYQLELKLSDVKGQKVGRASLGFEIGE